MCCAGWTRAARTARRERRSLSPTFSATARISSSRWRRRRHRPSAALSGAGSEGQWPTWCWCTGETQRKICARSVSKKWSAWVCVSVKDLQVMDLHAVGTPSGFLFPSVGACRRAISGDVFKAPAGWHFCVVICPKVTLGSWFPSLRSRFVSGLILIKQTHQLPVCYRCCFRRCHEQESRAHSRKRKTATGAPCLYTFCTQIYFFTRVALAKQWGIPLIFGKVSRSFGVHTGQCESDAPGAAVPQGILVICLWKVCE